jgi:hypothetical protein
MKIEMNRSKTSNPQSANPGMGNPMTPSPTSAPLKGGVHHAGTPETTTRNTASITGEGPDHIKGSESETIHGEKRKVS